MDTYEIKLDFVELAEKYAGKWVAMHPDTYEVISTGNSAEEVLDKAAELGIEGPFITDVVENYGSFVLRKSISTRDT